MHLDHARYPAEYKLYIKRKYLFSFVVLFLLLVSLVISMSLGSAKLSVQEVLTTMLGQNGESRASLIIWNIRFPQALVAIVAGAGLSLAGCVMQAILRNPLGSPFTLGISHAAAFGAALSVMVLGSGAMTSNTVGAVQIYNPFMTTAMAFVFSLLTSFIIIGIAKRRYGTPEVMILSGVALGAFFTAGTMLLQFFADDNQLAAMVFWTFGDAARGSWRELGFMAVVLLLCFAYFQYNSWNFNAMDSGDEAAKGLGVRVEQIRMVSMLLATMLTAVIIAFLGIIGFVGLVVPHMVRLLIGSDHRFLLPASCITGGLLLLLSDTAARLVLQPHVLPVSVLTSFLGAPAFFWLILRKRS